MVMVARKLPDLLDDEQKQIYDRIFDDGKKLNTESAVYQIIFKVFPVSFSAVNDFSIPKSWAAVGQLSREILKDFSNAEHLNSWVYRALGTRSAEKLGLLHKHHHQTTNEKSQFSHVIPLNDGNLKMSRKQSTILSFFGAV